jgi:pilus assembly protein CpaB
MNTARIIALTIALGAGGIAACLASGSDNKPAPAEPVAQLPKRGDGIDIVRYGIPSSQTTQK